MRPVSQQFTPVAPDDLTRLVADRIVQLEGRAIVLVDGADAAEPLAFAERIADTLRATGRECGVVSLHDYVHPASLRLEYGHTDEMSYRTIWFDVDAVRREVVDSFRADGRWLPALWDERRDRSARRTVVTSGPEATLIVAGPMLLGQDLHSDVSVRLHLTSGALQRKTPTEEQWTLAAIAEYERDSATEPDITVRWDHPDRPAMRFRD